MPVFCSPRDCVVRFLHESFQSEDIADASDLKVLLQLLVKVNSHTPLSQLAEGRGVHVFLFSNCGATCVCITVIVLSYVAKHSCC